MAKGVRCRLCDTLYSLHLYKRLYIPNLNLKKCLFQNFSKIGRRTHRMRAYSTLWEDTYIWFLYLNLNP